MTDSRFNGYIERFGDESWELDALEPQVIAALIRDNIEPLIDQELWSEVLRHEEAASDTMNAVAAAWDEVSGRYST